MGVVRALFGPVPPGEVLTVVENWTAALREMARSTKPAIRPSSASSPQSLKAWLGSFSVSAGAGAPMIATSPEHGQTGRKSSDLTDLIDHRSAPESD